MDIILPAVGELVWGPVFLLAQVLLGGLLAWDLKRREVAAWWLVGVVAVLMIPLGLIGWIVLRNPASHSRP